MNHTVESRLSWDVLQAYINSLIAQNIYTPSVAKPERKKKTDMAQISLFDTDRKDTKPETAPLTPASISENKSSSLCQEKIKEILRSGDNNINSRIRIYAKYERGKTPEYMRTFLMKEYGMTGKGFTFDSQNYAVWFDITGVTIGMGTSAFKNTVKPI